MYKLIVIIAAVMPIILALRALVGRSQKTSRVFSDFKKQIDYLYGDIVPYGLFFRLSARKHDPLHVEIITETIRARTASIVESPYPAADNRRAR